MTTRKGGCGLRQVRQSRRHGKLLLVLVLALGVLVVAVPAQAGPAQRDVTVLHPFLSSAVIPDTSSAPVRNDNGVAMTIHTSELTPGTATTVWWVIFNNPTSCISGAVLGLISRCGPLDLGRPVTEPSVQFATGHVIGGDGVGDFGAYLTAGDTPRCPHPAS